MEKPGPCQIQLIDMQGHTRYQTQQYANKGKNAKTIDVNSLPQGVYFLRVQSLEGVNVSKVLITR